MNPTTYVFDLAGVLCAFSPERRLQQLAEASGLAPGEVAQRLEVVKLIDRADRGELSREAEFEAATVALGLQCDYASYRALWCSAFTPDLEVIEVARRLSMEHRTAILTNNGPVLLDALSHDLGIVGQEFDELFVSAMFGGTKPSETVYRGVERALETPSEQLLLIDDSPGNVDGARRCGWQAIHFRSVEQLKAELA